MPALPLKFRILQLLSESPGLSCPELLDLLAAEYGGEGQFRPAVFEFHLLSMSAASIIEEKGIFNSGGQAWPQYAVTEYGASKLKYLPNANAPKTSGANRNRKEKP